MSMLWDIASNSMQPGLIFPVNTLVTPLTVADQTPSSMPPFGRHA